MEQDSFSFPSHRSSRALPELRASGTRVLCPGTLCAVGTLPGCRAAATGAQAMHWGRLQFAFRLCVCVHWASSCLPGLWCLLSCPLSDLSAFKGWLDLSSGGASTCLEIGFFPAGWGHSNDSGQDIILVLSGKQCRKSAFEPTPSWVLI